MKSLDDIPFKDLYPFEPHFLEMGKCKLHYVDEGSGPAVILLHGNPTWSFYYRDLIKVLRERFRVIAPDHMGCGLSSKPQDYPYNLETHVRNLHALIHDLHLDKLSMVVHDWGGPIGMGFAVARPTRVDRIVVLNSTASLDGPYPSPLHLCQNSLVGSLLMRRLNGFQWALKKFGTTMGNRLPEEVWAGYMYPYNSYRNRIAIHKFVQDIPLTDKHPSYSFAKKIEERLDRLADKKILIAWGNQDVCFTPVFRAKWEAVFPDAEVHTFGGAGHLVLEDAGPSLLEMIGHFLVDESKEADTGFADGAEDDAGIPPTLKRPSLHADEFELL